MLVGVGLATDAEEPEVEQPEGRRAPVDETSLLGEVPPRLRPGTRKAPAHLEHPIVLGAVALRPPVRVVEVLAAPASSVPTAWR